jgi:hypothetical protein
MHSVINHTHYLFCFSPPAMACRMRCLFSIAPECYIFVIPFEFPAHSKHWLFVLFFLPHSKVFISQNITSGVYRVFLLLLLSLINVIIVFVAVTAFFLCLPRSSLRLFVITLVVLSPAWSRLEKGRKEKKGKR